MGKEDGSVGLAVEVEYVGTLKVSGSGEVELRSDSLIRRLTVTVGDVTVTGNVTGRSTAIGGMMKVCDQVVGLH